MQRVRGSERTQAGASLSRSRCRCSAGVGHSFFGLSSPFLSSPLLFSSSSPSHPNKSPYHTHTSLSIRTTNSLVNHKQTEPSPSPCIHVHYQHPEKFTHTIKPNPVHSNHVRPICRAGRVPPMRRASSLGTLPNPSLHAIQTRNGMSLFLHESPQRHFSTGALQHQLRATVPSKTGLPTT